MIRVNLLSSLLLVMFAATSTQAQIQPLAFPSTSTPNNFYSDYVGVRLLINDPASVAGYKRYTITNENTGSTNDWGGAVTAPIVEKELVKASDSEGCTIAANTMIGKIAFIYRGNCEFGAKALNAQNAGALACIIVNNVTGGPVGMGAGAVGASVTIPVFMISKEDGDLINAEMNAGQTVTATISLWGTGEAHDLAIFDNSIALYHNYVTPLPQLAANNGNPRAYQAYDGAFIANLGGSTENSVQLKAVTSFTPEGTTTTTEIRRDSIDFAQFQVSDSILGIGMTSYDVHTTQKGRFDVKYTVSASGVDDEPSNNTASYSYYVSDNIFSKTRYDFIKDEPVATMWYRTGATPAEPFMAGNLYYVAKGGYGMEKVKLSLSKNGDTTLAGVAIEVYLFKWTDSLIPDSLMEIGEVEIVGIGARQFQSTDMGSEFYDVDMIPTDPSGNPLSQPNIVLEDNSWYYVAAVLPPEAYLGMDGVLNRYPRTFLRHHLDQFTEFYSSLYPGTLGDFISEAPNVVNVMYTFERGMLTADDAVDSARFAQQKSGLIPSISLHLTSFPVSVQNTPAKPQLDVTVYPNPAKNDVTVKIDLEKTASFVNYSVVDIAGRKLRHVQHANVNKETTSINVSDLASGTYFVIINADNNITVRKIIIAKD